MSPARGDIIIMDRAVERWRARITPKYYLQTVESPDNIGPRPDCMLSAKVTQQR
jgi:hypothetical protein